MLAFFALACGERWWRCWRCALLLTACIAQSKMHSGGMSDICMVGCCVALLSCRKHGACMRQNERPTW